MNLSKYCSACSGGIDLVNPGLLPLRTSAYNVNCEIDNICPPIYIGGQILSISQFTLYADVRKGNRPGFTKSMPPEQAEQYFDKFNDVLRSYGGIFFK